MKPQESDHMSHFVRRAKTADIPAIISLLHQVNMVHHRLRPDLFKPHTTKYNEQEVAALIADELTPVFVYDEGGVLGYAICQIDEVRSDRLLQDGKTLYIDDICVDESARGRHIGKALFDFVSEYARSAGCTSITLNVWAGNEAAMAFYQRMGMQVQKTGMEMRL